MKLQIAGLMLTWLLLTSAAVATEVKVQSGSLTVHADGVPLSEVLGAIGEQANLKIISIGGNPSEEAAVWHHFTDLPLEKAITRLLKGCNHILVRDQSTGSLEEIYILANDVAKQVSVSTLDNGFPDRLNARGKDLEADNIEINPDSRSVIEWAQTAQDPEEQIQALHELAYGDDPRTGDVVRQALLSTDSDVRLAALSTMYQALPDNPADRVALRRLVTQDASHAVRAEALEMFLQGATADEANALRSEMEGDGFAGIFAMQQFM